MFRVLLADDEVLALEGLQTLIDWNKYGFEVAAVARDGAQALAQLREIQPDLVVTDLYMPLLDGLGLMEAARQEGYTGEFLIVSGYSEFSCAHRALSLKAAGYLLKPIDTEEAEKVVRNVYQKLSSRLTSTKRKEAFCDYHSQVTQALTLAWNDAVCLPTNAYWQLITWGAPIPYEVSLALVEAATRCGVTATVHIIREEEWLLLQAAQPIDAGLPERIAQRVQQQGRSPCLLPSELKPHQFFAAREAFQNRRQKENKLADMLPREKLNRLSAHKSHESAVEALLRMAKEPGGETLTLESAAHKIGYNTAYLGRLFKKEMHQSFQNYMKQLRLTRIAQALLEQPEISAQELALQSGFYDYPTFYKCFKSKYGCSPDQYRVMYSHCNHERRGSKEPC